MPKNSITEITVPQLGVNELEATLVSWEVAQGSVIDSGDVICELEDTKTTFAVEAEASGYIVFLVPEDSEVSVNDTIALVGSDLTELQKAKDDYIAHLHQEASAEVAVVASKKAIRLAQKLGVDIANVPSDNAVLRAQDIQTYSDLQVLRRKREEQEIRIKLSVDKRSVIIFGAGQGAVTVKECLDLSDKYEVVGFIVDDDEHTLDFLGLPLYHSSRLPEIVQAGAREIALAVASGMLRLSIIERCEEAGAEMINVIHPTAFISPSVSLGKSLYIKSGAIIETNTSIGDGCIVDNRVTIAHDNIIGNGCHLAPGASLGSNIRIGTNTVVGIGASISTKVEIGEHCIISVGSSVTKNMPSYSVVEGTPGKIVGKRKKPVSR